MSNPNLSNPEKLVNEARLNEYHQTILPYLGGHIECGFTPVGAVIMMSGNEAPKHYLPCDGTVYNIADYPELAAFYARSQGSCNFYGGNGTTTFAVPDLRGEFVRGTGTNSHTNQGNGANVGVHQDGTAVRAEFALNIDPDVGLYIGHLNKDSASEKIVTNVDRSYGSASTTTYRTDVFKRDAQVARTDGRKTYETVRPTNTSVLFCVASKNIYLDARFDYSLEEKVVGEWIDGKPLYQKTFNVSIPTNNTAVRVCTDSDLNISDVISMEGTIITSSNAKVPLPTNDGTNKAYLSYNTQNNVVLTYSSYYEGKSAVITIQYTKTTDA